MRLPDEFYERVQNRVRRRLAERGLDGIIVTAPADVAYLIGFFYAVTERPVYLWFGVDGSRFVLMPELDAEYALAQNVYAEIRTYFEYPGVTRPEVHLAAALRDLGVRSERVGVTASLSIGARDALGDALPGATFTRTAVVSELRVVKEPEEIALHRQAAEICDDMLDAGRRLIEEALAGGTPLPTESDLARHVIAYGTDRMYTQYAHVIYTTKLAGGLVYAGPNAARPHGLPSRRRLEVGDTLILSLGAAVASRFVESERTFIIGPPSRQQREFYAVAQRAQEVGTQAMVAGRSCGDVNAEALDVIRDAGMGEYIRHRLGHGIGIAQHEPPWVEDGDSTVLVPGMVLSSEPGIYVPGHAGYRISDSVLVTAAGPERLTRYPRQLEENVIT